MAGVPTEQARNSWGPAWLVVAEGGWWKASEVTEKLGVSLDHVQKRLCNMVTEGYLARRKIPVAQRAPASIGSAERTEYAVLPTCRIPRGLSVDEVTKAFGLARNET